MSTVKSMRHALRRQSRGIRVAGCTDIDRRATCGKPRFQVIAETAVVFAARCTDTDRRAACGERAQQLELPGRLAGSESPVSRAGEEERLRSMDLYIRRVKELGCMLTRGKNWRDRVSE